MAALQISNIDDGFDSLHNHNEPNSFARLLYEKVLTISAYGNQIQLESLNVCKTNESLNDKNSVVRRKIHTDRVAITTRLYYVDGDLLLSTY